MIKYTGKSVYGAVAMGKVEVFDIQEPMVKRVRIDDTERELKRVEEAKKAAIRQLEDIYEQALTDVGKNDAKIFEIHIMLIKDDDYNKSIRGIIETQHVNAEYAVALTSDNFSEMFAAMEDMYMRARAADVKDVSRQIIANLTGSEDRCRELEDEVIICADDLAPSEMAKLDKSKVLAFVTAHGSSHSHTAILARMMNIPAIVDLREAFLSAAKNSSYAIVDGYMGDVILDPDDETVERYMQKKTSEEERQRLLCELKGKDNVTADGTEISICANIDSPDNIGAVLYKGADGIGLFRSEFLYLKSSSAPTEEEQFAVYKRILESMSGRKVIIRTIDIGADKRVDYLGLKDEENPALGCRGIRYCLTHTDIFRTQLRALFRASAFGTLGIMFPMITSVCEVERILELCNDVKRELDEQGISYSDHVELGVMIETPAAAIISDRLAPLVDFFSVGTNDLTQFTVACDRQNPDLDSFMNEPHEAVLRLIEMSAENAHKNGIWIGICGELACDISLTEKFLRMGIDELSVAPGFVLTVRDAVGKIDLGNE